MERNVSSLAIVLHSIRYGQMNRRLKLLTVDFGLIDVVSYGARKSLKAVKGDVFSDGQFFLYHNPVKRDYTLKDVQVIATHDEIRSDLGSNYAALFFCELVMKTNGGDSASQYRLLSTALDLLCSQPNLVARILIQFVLRLLDVCGLQADYARCPICERVYGQQEIIQFNAQLGAPCCQQCATLDSGMILGPGARRYLTLTKEMDYHRAVEIALSEQATLRIKAYMLRYALILSGGQLNTLSGGMLQTLF
ncbi:DNA repair protein RecO [Sphaerochaeta sp. PS]|uniref:DNA repair protein RecO n=1 Tax=Sphaerochaeta sp. PS TaxID=3076336 RepID=UPI0028A34987|nr:DNA repair protein RecO [Sphaerochaeta sp. PS]MDT4761754.1 DNA repair protein RecO [Sphaerochaeta sp. PS]